MRNPQVVLKIFLQHYFDIDWSYTAHLRYLLEYQVTSMDYSKHLHILTVIHRALQWKVTAKTLHFCFHFCSKKEVAEGAAYWSLLISAHFASNAEKAYVRGNKLAGDCWNKVAKEIRISVEKKVVLTPSIVQNYLQAEIEESKAAIPVNECYLRLLESRLQQFQGCCEQAVTRDIRLSVASTWKDLLLESYSFHKAQWIHYCQRMSRQAKLAGNSQTSDDWLGVRPLVWGIKEKTTTRKEDNQEEGEQQSKTLFLLIAQSYCRDSGRLSSLNTSKYWDYLMVSYRQERFERNQFLMRFSRGELNSRELSSDGEEEEEEDDLVLDLTGPSPIEQAITTLLEAEDCYCQLRSLLKKVRGRASQHKDNPISYLWELVVVLEKLEAAVLSRFEQRSPPDILLPDFEVFVSSLESFIHKVHDFIRVSRAIVICYEMLWFNPEIKSLLRLEGLLSDEEILKQTNRLIDNCIAGWDHHHKRSSSEEADSSSWTMTFKDSSSDDRLILLSRAIRGVALTCQWILEANDGLIPPIPLRVTVLQYGRRLVESILMSDLESTIDNHVWSENLLRGFEITERWQIYATKASLGAPQKETILKLRIQLWQELSHLDFFQTKTQLSIKYCSQPLTLPQVAWSHLVSYLNDSLQEEKSSAELVSERSLQIMRYYLNCMTTARQNQPSLLLSSLYFQIAEIRNNTQKGKGKKKKEEEEAEAVIHWLEKAIEASESKKLKAAGLYQTAARLQAVSHTRSSTDESHFLLRLVKVLPSVEAKIRWKEMAELCIASDGTPPPHHNPVIEEYCQQNQQLLL